MGTLFENEAYAQPLSARGQTPEIMLGYSNSDKENGFLAANWSLYKNQRRLGDICDDYGRISALTVDAECICAKQIGRD